MSQKMAFFSETYQYTWDSCTWNCCYAMFQPDFSPLRLFVSHHFHFHAFLWPWTVAKIAVSYSNVSVVSKIEQKKMTLEVFFLFSRWSVRLSVRFTSFADQNLLVLISVIYSVEYASNILFNRLCRTTYASKIIV